MKEEMYTRELQLNLRRFSNTQTGARRWNG
jgi:hypothetical protein